MVYVRTASVRMTMTAEDDFNKKWLNKFKLISGIGLSEEEYKNWVEAKDFERCEKYKSSLLKTSPLVIFLVEHLRRIGVDFNPSDAIHCRPCSATRGGGFSPQNGILLCSNKIFSYNQMQDILSHELIHSWDHHRFKVDWNNLKHHACSEIRAANLSGDCKFFREFARGNVGFNKHQQECVRRRAILSLQANFNCRSAEQAESVVNQVFESCYNDTRPFDEIY